MRHCTANLVLLMSTLIAAGCGSPEHNFSKLTDEFVYSTLAFSPVGATAAGLHRFQGRNLDEQLDDMSPATLDHHREYYQRFRERLQNQVKPDALSAQSRADLRIIQDQLALRLLDLEETQTYLHNPAMYVEMAGNALFTPLTLEYAPLPERIRHIVARLKILPLLLDQARTNLVSSPAIWTQVALEENQGNIALVDQAIRAAVQALSAFQHYLQGSLALRDNYDWRLGRDLYTRKFRYALASGSDPTDVLDVAARSLQEARVRMLALALPLHARLFPNHRDHADLAGPARETQVISEVLDRIAGRHSTRLAFLDDASRDLDEARQFVAQKHLVTLPPQANLQVIPTPVFMRGAYEIGRA